MSPKTDFDPITGQLVPVDPFPTPPAPEPTLINPTALSPTGSPPGKLVSADWLRTAWNGLGLYGVFQAAVTAMQYFGLHPSQLGTYGAEIAAVLVALSQLGQRWLADNRPRTP